MKPIKRRLKETHGFTLIELIFTLTIFVVGIVPIYKMILSGAKMQTLAEETYEATLHSQALLQEVIIQIENDLEKRYKDSREGPVGRPSLVENSWLDFTEGGAYPLSVFLKQKSEVLQDPENTNNLFSTQFNTKFNTKYNLKDYMYEVYIWPMDHGELTENMIYMATYENPILMAEVNKNPPFEYMTDKIGHETEEEIENRINQYKRYFNSYDALIWAGLRRAEIGLIGIGEIIYGDHKTIEIRVNEHTDHNIEMVPPIEQKFLGPKVDIKYVRHSNRRSTEEQITHELVIENIDSSEEESVIQLSIDLTTFPKDTPSKIIRIENRTKAKVVIPVYDEKNLADIKVYPIQENIEGSIVVESRPKLQPSENFIISIIVKDAKNSIFGDESKILSKIVDVYSFDYKKQ